MKPESKKARKTERTAVRLPIDSRKLHLDNVRTLDPMTRADAVDFLKAKVIAWPEFEELKAKAQADPEWWITHHFGAMMDVRNRLREAGYGEKEFGIDNLDDYAVGLLELALGVTSLG